MLPPRRAGPPGCPLPQHTSNTNAMLRPGLRVRRYERRCSSSSAAISLLAPKASFMVEQISNHERTAESSFFASSIDGGSLADLPLRGAFEAGAFEETGMDCSGSIGRARPRRQRRRPTLSGAQMQTSRAPTTRTKATTATPASRNREFQRAWDADAATASTGDGAGGTDAVRNVNAIAAILRIG